MKEIYEIKKSTRELFNLSVWQRSWMQQRQCKRKLAVVYMGTSQMSSLLAGSESFHSS